MSLGAGREDAGMEIGGAAVQKARGNVAEADQLCLTQNVS
jgi:hypothetical protein